MDKIFADIPVDEETKIIKREQHKWDNLDVVYELWLLSGYSIIGKSVIFISDQVKNLSEKEICDKVRKFFKYKGEVTFSDHKSGLVFVNFDILNLDK